jgi:hypothetical protein
MARRLIALPLAALVLLNGAAGAQPPKCGKTVGLTTELGITAIVPMAFTAAAGTVLSYPPLPESGARYIRVRVEVSDVPACAWYLSVRDEHYRLIQTLTENDFPQAGIGWTRRIPGGQVLFDVQPCADGRQPAIRFDGYVWMPKVLAKDRPYYSWQGATAAYRDIVAADRSVRRLGDYVGLLIGSWDRRVWVCSGVAIAPELFLTNWHCGGLETFQPTWYWNDTLRRDLIIDLSWDGDLISREHSVAAVVASSEPLDYALLRMRSIEAAGRVRPPVLSSTSVNAHDELIVVHHAEGLPKQVSRQCTVASAAHQGWRNQSVLSDFTHLCDTESGSSGGAVFNPQGRLVGLHHLGFEFDRQCRPDGLNKALHISQILADIETRNAAAHAEIMSTQPRP